MRHKYETEAVVLGRTPLAESASLIALLTPDFGLLRARAEGVRKPGAKLAHALRTLDRSQVTLVRGKEAWRIAGAIPGDRPLDGFDHGARVRAGRVAGLFTRLLRGESNDPRPHALLSGLLNLLPGLDEPEADALEIETVLRLLMALGLDPGPAPDTQGAPLGAEERRALVTRINRGLDASGL